MPLRKPAPKITPPPLPPREQQDKQKQKSSAADPLLRRYTLTDTPTPPITPDAFTMEQNAISQAVDQLLENRYSSVANGDEGEEEHTPYFGDARSSSGNSNYSDADEGPFEEPQRASTVPPYLPGQLLPTIVTGETLNLDEYGQQQPSPYEAFPDVPPLPQVPLPTNQPYAHYAPPDQSDNYHYMPQHNTPYQHIDPEGLPAGIDHFQHDTEAYASGNVSRDLSYRPPRSRSPTAAVDDEDYYIVGNESVHYTGPEWDREKTHGYEGNFLNDKYADAFGQDGHYGESESDGASHMTPISSIQYLEPDAPEETRHYGPAPSGRILRRHKTKKRVQLTNGNLVVDISVPPKMVLPYRNEPEMNATRYTAVTCDPDDFEKNGFFLRQNESGRRTELFIVVTMYNVCTLLFSNTQLANPTWDCRKMKFFSVGRCMG